MATFLNISYDSMNLISFTFTHRISVILCSLTQSRQADWGLAGSRTPSLFGLISTETLAKFLGKLQDNCGRATKKS